MSIIIKNMVANFLREVCKLEPKIARMTNGQAHSFNILEDNFELYIEPKD
jgi:hypothetical protein